MAEFLDPEVYTEFVVEGRDHLDSIEPKLLDLEKNPEDRSILDDIFRPMHSLKGASGFLGLEKINTLAHKGENILDELRKGKMKVTPEIMDIILETTDTLRLLLDNLEEQGQEGDVDIEPILKRIENVMQGELCAEDKKSSSETQIVSKEGEGYKLTIISPEHLLDFIEEAEEIISQLNDNIVKLEKDPKDEDLINDIFRAFHNLKGNSGIIGYEELNKLAHTAETLLNKARNKEIEISSELIDILLRSVDVISDLIGRIDRDSGWVERVAIDEILTSLAAYSDDKDINREKRISSASQEIEVRKDEDEDLEIYKSTVDQQFDNIVYGLDNLRKDPSKRDLVDGLYRSFLTIQNASAYMEFKEVSDYAKGIVKLIDDARNKNVDFSLMLDLLHQEQGILRDIVEKNIIKYKEKSEHKDREREKYSKTKEQKDKESISTSSIASKNEEDHNKDELENKENKIKKLENNKKESKPIVKKKKEIISTIRVEHTKLDQLMNLIGELIINRNRFAQITKELEETQNVQDIVLKLNESVDAMARISDALQDTIMQVRMVPVRSVFSRFPRLIRDLSRKSKKPVELITEGEDTELDKSVIELIGDPLVHILRNAVDHGLETEEERKAKGKPIPGKVWLRASHRGNSVVIEVEDDGRGIDPEKMRRKALEKGLITYEEAEAMDDQQAIELIFLPGFSTAEKVTDISGRGVGMDVVKNNIRALKGNVSVSSEIDKGTKLVITLPLTLAIIDALMIKVSGDTFALPLDAVSETTKILASSLSEINKRKAITLRGEVLGLVYLADLLNLPKIEENRELLPVVILQVGERKLGLVVDVLLERQEIVIKSLGEYLGDVQAISGATIMGDGNVILILDPNEIYQLATQKGHSFIQ